MLITNETLVSSQAIAAAGTYYTNSTDFGYNHGVCALILDFLSGTGPISVYQQCSLNNATWYEPIGSGSGASLATVCTGRTVSSWIVFDSVQAEYVRFRIVNTGASSTTIRLKLTFPESYE